MPIPLAHGDWITLGLWLVWMVVQFAAWIVLVSVATLILGLAYGPLLLKRVRKGRHLLWLMPLLNVGIFFLLNPAPAVGQRFALWPGLLTTSGWIAAGLSGLIAATFVGSARRVVRGIAESQIIPAPAPVPVPTIPTIPADASSRSVGFRTGLQAPVEGLRYLIAHPHLWRYAALPIVLNVLVTGLVLLVLVAAGAWFAVQLHPQFSPTWWGVVLEVLAGAAILVVALALAAVTWLVLNGILCGHFYGKLARQVELQLGTRPEELAEVPLRQQVVDTFRDLASLLAINAGLLLLNVVPVIGSIAALVLGVYFDGFIFGRDYLDFPMSLRGYPRDLKNRLARNHRWQVVGVGAAVFAFNLVPLIGSVLNAGAAVGAVLLFHRWPDGRPHETTALGTSPRPALQTEQVGS